MDNLALQLVTWGIFATHLAVGLVGRRRKSGIPLVPLLNLVIALGVVTYWAQRWVTYARGVTWYWTDQLIPLYALAVCILSALGLAGRLRARWPHWVVFGAHSLVLLAAALFATLLTFGAGI